MWNLVGSKCICDQDCLFLLFLCLNWWSDLIGNDRQQDPISLTFARPEQIGVATMTNIIHKCHAYNKVFFLNLIS